MHNTSSIYYTNIWPSYFYFVWFDLSILVDLWIQAGVIYGVTKSTPTIVDVVYFLYK